MPYVAAPAPRKLSWVRKRRLWDGGHGANLILAKPVGIKAAEPWHLVSNLDPGHDLVCAYGQRFCCEQLFCDQKSVIFQLERSGLQKPPSISTPIQI